MDVDGFKSLEVIIENTGKSDFTFVIIPKSELEEYVLKLEDYSSRGRTRSALVRQK